MFNLHWFFPSLDEWIIIGWFLSAYFLGGYGEDGRGMNGYSKAVIAASKSWALGIPVSLSALIVFVQCILVLNSKVELVLVWLLPN